MCDIDMRTLLLPSQRVVSTVVDVYFRILEIKTHEDKAKWANAACVMRSYLSVKKPQVLCYTRFSFSI